MEIVKEFGAELEIQQQLNDFKLNDHTHFYIQMSNHFNFSNENKLEMEIER